MLKTIILTITIMLVFTACLHKENPEPKEDLMKKAPIKDGHYKVVPKLSHSFYY